MNPSDDCSEYYPVPKRCQTSKRNDWFIYDPVSVMCVTYYSQLLKCKSKPIVTLNIFAILGFLNVVKKVKGPNSWYFSGL